MYLRATLCFVRVAFINKCFANEAVNPYCVEIRALQSFILSYLLYISVTDEIF